MSAIECAVATIRRARLLPVLVIDDADRAEPLGAALLEGGLPVAEVTFRTPAAVAAIERLAGSTPSLLVGAGTVRTRAQAARAVDAGARFVVSPGLDRGVVEYCLERDVAVHPGVCTPTEVQAALGLGITVLKFFPAEAMGGVRFLEALAGPFQDAEFIPTGGIDAAKLPAYLGSRRVIACGGSWMAPRGWIAGGAFDRIREEVARAVTAVSELESDGGGRDG